MLVAMSSSPYRAQASAWARVARAAAAAHEPRVGASASRELFDAIEHAATEGRLDLRDLVDAYCAGTPELDVSDAWDEVVAYLDRITDVQALTLELELARVQRALPDWRRRLGLRIAAHDLALAAHRALGGQDARIEQTRVAVADMLEGARAADASDDQLDVFIRELRVEQCDLLSVITTAQWLAAERERLAQRRGMTLPDAPWATTAEIADDRSAPLDVVTALVDDALQHGLLAAHDRGVVVTPAGRQHALQAAAS